MLVVNQKFYDTFGNEVSIKEKDKLFTTFSDGTKWMTCEIDLLLKNEKNTKSVEILNRLELIRRKEKFNKGNSNERN